MRCPSLAELPPPPEGKTGWPWTEETPLHAAARPDGSPWPRISVVTPSYNQGQFIEETIRSILLQGYPDLEYIIIDGGSADGSAEIIKKYEPWLTYWESEKDRGQAHAINKGFERATGVIGAYLNSDDYYLPGALGYAAKSFVRHRWDLLMGRSSRPSPSWWNWLRRPWWISRYPIVPLPPFLIHEEHYGICQESTFWNLEKFKDMKFDEQLQFCLDADWYFRIARGAKILSTSRQIGYFRLHAGSKTATMRQILHSEGPVLLQREIANGISRSENTRIERRYRMTLPYLVLQYAIFGISEFPYTHPGRRTSA